MKLLKTLFGLVVAGACSGAAAQWQWIDSDGRKVFSDRAPPPEVPDKSIVKRPPSRNTVTPAVTEQAGTADATAAAVPVLPVSAAKTSVLDKELEARKREAVEAEAARKKAEEARIAKAKIENCVRAKQAKAGLDSGIRIGRVNASGEKEIMDDAARAIEAKRIQGIIASDCN